MTIRLNVLQKVAVSAYIGLAVNSTFTALQSIFGWTGQLYPANQHTKLPLKVRTQVGYEPMCPETVQTVDTSDWIFLAVSLSFAALQSFFLRTANFDT